MGVLLLLLSVSFACQCTARSISLEVGTVDAPAIIPANGAFLWFDTLGGDSQDAYHIVDSYGARVDAEPDVWQGIESTMIRLVPTDALEPGSTYFLTNGSSLQSFPHFVEAEDSEPPVLFDLWYGNKEVIRNTSCGDIRSVPYEFDPSVSTFSEDTIVVTHDLEEDEYWFLGGLSWVEQCGGYPPEFWGHRKDVFLMDRAGNVSESVRIRGPGCSCNARPASSLPGGVVSVLALFAMIVGRRRALPCR